MRKHEDIALNFKYMLFDGKPNEITTPNWMAFAANGSNGESLNFERFATSDWTNLKGKKRLYYGFWHKNSQ